jgi:hypothetical protein
MTDPHLRVVRLFNWGLLILADRGTKDLPDTPAELPDLATATRSAVLLNVRHAADVDLNDEPAQVAVNAYIGTAPELVADFRALLDVPSGVLEIGDAEGVAELDVGPGTWLLTANVRPAEHPDTIDIWVEPHE